MNNLKKLSQLKIRKFGKMVAAASIAAALLITSYVSPFIGTHPIVEKAYGAGNGMMVGIGGSIGSNAYELASYGILNASYDDPIVRVGLFRHADSKLETDKGLDKIYDRLKSRFVAPTEGGIFFTPNATFNALRGKGVVFGEYNSGSKSINMVGDPTVAANIVNKSGNHTSTVYYSSIVGRSAEDLKGAWMGLATNYNASVGVWAHILQISGSTYQIDTKIKQIFNPDGLDMNNIVNWTDAQKQDQFYRYLDMLMTLYTCAEGNSKTAWQNAINDYLTGNNLDTRPVTISIDIAPVVTQPGNTAVILSAIDYHQYCTATESMYDLTSDVWAKSSEAGTVAGHTEDQLIKSTQLSLSASANRARMSDSYNANNAFSHGQSAITDKLMRTSGGNAYWTTYVNIAYLNALRFVRPSGGGSNNVIGFAVLPAPIPAPSTSWAQFEALPDNKVVFSEQIAHEVDLHVTSGVSNEDLGKWRDLVKNAKTQGKQFTVEIQTSRTSGQVGGNGTYSPNVTKLTYSPDKMWAFISGKEEILYYDTSTATVSIANKQRIVFTYTVNMKIKLGNQEFTATLSDDASFVRKGERIGYTSTPEAYSELKNYGGGSNMSGSLNEDWEAMAGVPSTEQLYFAAGGSEFIVDVTLEYMKNETAVRTYDSWFTGTDCEFKVADQSKNYTVPSPSGSASADTALHVHGGDVEVSATWTGSIPNLATTATGLHKATCTAVPDRAAYNTAKAQAQAWVAALNSTVIQHTSASDKINRTYKLVASITADTPVDPITTSDSQNCSKAPGKPPTPCGNEQATANPGPAGNYTISVKSTIKQHMICGPCCSHYLPEAHDTWEQTFNYDSMKIVDVHVWKIDQAAINGMSEVTSKDIISADIVRGEPNFFYNIALKKDAAMLLENRAQGGATGQSGAGRVRYSVDSPQHDVVTYNNGTRPNKCDGMSTTYGTNVQAAGGKGHGESYSTGFIYESHKRGTSVTGTTSPSSDHYPRNEVGHLQAGTDAKDKGTVEYAKFLSQRTKQNTITMISDFLILQTSSGDQSVMYYDQRGGTVTTETKFPDMRVTKETLWDSNGNSASKWKADAINVGGYNGGYQNPSSKFNGSGKTNAKKTVFEPDPANTISKPAVSRNMMLYQGQINIILQNTNKSYLVGKGEVFWANVLHWTDRTGEGFSGVSNPTTTAPYNVTAISQLINYEAKANHGHSNFSTEGQVGGFKLNAPYSKSHRKTNDLVVHDPVSTEFAIVESLPDDRDQRIKDTLVGGADQTQDELSKSQVCPRQPGLCEFRVLNCNYLKNQLLAEFDFDTLVGNQVVNKVTGSRYTLPAGFTVSNAADGFTSKYLRAYGTRWQIPFSDLGLDYATGVNLRVEADVKMPQSNGSGTMLFSFFNYDFYIPAGQAYGTVNTGSGWEKQSNVPVANNTKMHVAVDFNFFDSTLSRVYINGRETGYTYLNPSNELSSTKIGDSLYVGSWGIDGSYPAAFSIDNLKVTRMAGTQNHTNACYRSVTMHPDGLNRHQHTQACLNGTWDCGNWPLNNNYQHGGYYGNNWYSCNGVINTPGNTYCGCSHCGNPACGSGYCSNHRYSCNSSCSITYPKPAYHTHSGAAGPTPNGCYTIGSHQHVGYPGLVYANGCYTNPTTHEHNGYCKLNGAQGFVNAVNAGEYTEAQLRAMLGAAYDSVITGEGGGAVADGTVWNFEYTGGVQTWVAPAGGTYKLDVWGASGGKSAHGVAGGLGGSATGNIQIENREALYVYVGGAGGGVYGGWNGGGHGSTTNDDSAGGGGGTDIRTLQSSDYSNRVIVAGGGGGAGCRDTYGGAGGNNNGSSGTGDSYRAGGPGTQTAGGVNGGNSYNGSFGVGGSTGTSQAWPGAGGGGGYYGGGAGANLSGGGGSGGGGSGYTGGVSGWSMSTGVRSGNGRATITAIKTKPPFATTLDKVLAAWSLIPEASPIFVCKQKPLNIHVCNGNCFVAQQLNCTEPHHSKLHYDGSSDICWDACGSDLNHKSYKPVINTSDGSFKAGNFLNMDYGFRVYFPNEGDFDQGEPYGIGSLTDQRGLGFTDNQDTTKWTRVKRVRFGFNSIYNGKLYLANEWIVLGDRGSYTGAPGSKYDATKWTNYNSNRPLYNDVSKEWYDFYCVLANYEAKATKYEYEVEAVNCPGGNDNYDNTTNRERTGSFTALHGGYKMGYIDVVGRIGNLVMEDSGDFRYSNLFKTAITGTTKVSQPPVRFDGYRGGMQALEGTAPHNSNSAWFVSTAVGGGVRGARQDLAAGIYEFIVEGEGLQNGKIKLTSGNGALDITDKATQVGIATTKMTYKVVIEGATQSVELWWTANNNMSMTIKSISTQFKGTDEEKWLVDGVVGEVDESNQNFYLTWGKDIRGLPISASTKFINTYGTRTWIDGLRKRLPLSPEKNSIEILQEDPLLVGYDMYTDISTIGNYYLNNSSQLQVVPYYYAMDISRPTNPTLIPVDVYLLHNGTYEPINIFDKVKPNWDKDSVYDWIVNLDWVAESTRRNYTLGEKQRTDFLADKLKESVSDSAGNFLTYKLLDTPIGGFYTLGNAQMMVSNGKSRTFIGGETTYGELKNLGGGDRITIDEFGVPTNPSGRIPADQWWRAAQRWHMKLGLPSSAVFVRRGTTPNADTVKEFDDNKYVVLSTADIRVIGDTYILGYNQQGDNGSINIKDVNGNWAGPFTLPGNIPTVFAVYSTTRKSVLDVDIVGIY